MMLEPMPYALPPSHRWAEPDRKSGRRTAQGTVASDVYPEHRIRHWSPVVVCSVLVFTGIPPVCARPDWRVRLSCKRPF
jgi:hypothetical protein